MSRLWEEMHQTKWQFIPQVVQWTFSVSQISELKFDVCRTPTWYWTLIWPFTCPDCGKKCTRQNGSSFHKWYNEHFQSLKYQNSTLTFAEHLHGTGNSFGLKEYIRDTLQFVQKGKLMNSLEKFDIYSETIGNKLT